MTGNWLARAAGVAVRHPRRVLVVTALALGLAGYAVATRLTLKTSNLDLVDPTQPPIAAFLDIARSFGTPNVLVAVLEGDNQRGLEAAIDRMIPALEALPEVRGVVARIPLDPAVLARAGRDAYLSARDHRLYVMVIQPEDDRSQAETIAPMIDGVRGVLAAETRDGSGIRAGLTGIPQYAIDDRDVIQRDIQFLSLVSFVLIGALFAVGFSSIRRPVLAMVTLAAAVALVLGLVTWVPGHLTLLSAFFASILFGLGIDAGIHLINRMEECLDGGMDEGVAVVEAVGSMSRELTAGAVTTAAAFFALCATDFRGFAELGMIAGTGVLVCLWVMVTVFPALLMVMPGRGERVARPGRGRVGRWLMAVQRPVLAGGLAVAGVVLAVLGGPGFDGNYTHLQPRDSESVRLEQAISRETSWSTQFAVFAVEGKARAVALADRLLDEPTVSDVRSVADLELLAPVDGEDSPWPPAFLRGLVGEDGRYAVYAYPAGDIWEPATQDAFVAAMEAVDPGVTGMPWIGRHMTELSRRSMRTAAWVGGLLVLACVLASFRRVEPALLALLPTVLTMAGLHGLLKLMGHPFNPINIMALPVILGVAVDDGVHMVHRFLREDGEMGRTLAGSGRGVVLTSLTTMAAFGSLIFTRHRGLSSFAMVLVLGVAYALVLSVLVLPGLMRLRRASLLKHAQTDAVSAHR